MYAHKKRRHLLVSDVRRVSGSEGGQFPPFVFPQNNWVNVSDDFLVTNNNDSGVFEGTTLVAEYPSFPVVRVACVYTPQLQQSFFVVSCSSSRESPSQNPLQTATHHWKEAVAMGRDALWQENQDEWSALWDDVGIDVSGHRLMAQLINASFCSLFSEIRLDWPQGGLSVGGTSTNGKYHGHIFSDAETWMGPPLALFSPEIMRTILRYRLGLVQGARDKAASYGAGYKGTMFPWESAAFGNETCPQSAPTGQYEQHISGDIGAAVQRYWHSTRDLQWLRTEGFPLMEGIASFWMSRVSCNEGDGQCHIRGVISMDERTFNVSDECYTNAAAAQSLLFYAHAASLLNLTISPLPERIAHSIPVLLNQNESMHLPWQNYNGSFGGLPTLMLGFPLGVQMSPKVRFNDVMYYTQNGRTTYMYAPTGMAQAMSSVALLEIGALSDAMQMFQQIQEDFSVPYAAPIELRAELGYGQANFITSCGGFLQAILFGFCGIRMGAQSFNITPSAIMPPEVTQLRLRGVRFLQSVLQLSVGEKHVCVTLEKRGPFSLFYNGLSQPMQTGKTYCDSSARIIG